MSWPQPDTGFTNLYVTDNLIKKLESGQWFSLPADATGWLNVGGTQRLTVINQSTLNAVLSYPPDRCWFGLFHP